MLPVNQMVFDHMLDKVCADRGLPILRGREVVGIEDKGTHVELMWKRHMPKEHRMGVDKAAMDEEVHRMSALFVVGCDGAHSRVRESAGIKFIPQAKGQQHRWLVLDVQAKPGTDSSHLKWKDAGIFRQYNTPSRPCTSAPSPAFRRRIEFMILPHEPSCLAQDDDFVWSLLKPWGCNPDNATLARRTIFSPQGGWAECFSRGRVVLAGDAAHNSPQFLGAGANTGLRDAKSLAWRLQLAVKHPEIDYELLLHDYSVEQHGIAAKLVTMALDLERLIAVTDPELARNRDTELMQAPIVEGYPDVEALGPPGMYLRDEEEVKRGHDTGGHLFIHDDVVYHGKRGPFDVVVGQGWLLLGSGPEAPAAMLEPRTRDQYRTKLSGSFVHCGRDAGFEDVSGRYTGWFRNNEAYAVLVRPDFYIYGVAKTRADVQRIVRTALDHISSVA